MALLITSFVCPAEPAKTKVFNTFVCRQMEKGMDGAGYFGLASCAPGWEDQKNMVFVETLQECLQYIPAQYHANFLAFKDYPV
jgi:hypothetical protein